MKYAMALCLIGMIAFMRYVLKAAPNWHTFEIEQDLLRKQKRKDDDNLPR